MRDWVSNVDSTHYILGTVAGPSPFPRMVRDFQRVIGDEARAQVLELTGRAARRRHRVGRGRVERDRDLLRLHRRPLGPPGRVRGRWRRRRDGPARRDHHRGARPASCTAPVRTSCRTTWGRPSSRTRSAPGSTTRASGLSTPGCNDTGRATYRPVTDKQAMDAFALLCRTEGIIPAIESAHAIAGAVDSGASSGRTRRPGQPLGPRGQGRRHRGGVVRPHQRAGRQHHHGGRAAVSTLADDLRPHPSRRPSGAGRLPSGRVPERRWRDRGPDGDGGRRRATSSRSACPTPTR